MVGILMNADSAARGAAFSLLQGEISKSVIFKTSQAFFSAEPYIAFMILMDVADTGRNKAIFLGKPHEFSVLIAGQAAIPVTDPQASFMVPQQRMNIIGGQSITRRESPYYFFPAQQLQAFFCAEP